MFVKFALIGEKYPNFCDNFHGVSIVLRKYKHYYTFLQQLNKKS